MDFINHILDQKSLSILIFLVTYVYIAIGRREKHITALIGAVLIYILGVLSATEILSYIDFETLGLLFGMMIIVGGLKESGFFYFIGLHIAKFSRCIPIKMFVLLMVITALLSALLANVTVVLFMTMIVIELSELLKIDSTPFIVGEILASNIGGSSTLIGDPPNIMVATQTHMSFTDFLINIAPASIISLIAAIIILYFMYRDEMGTKEILIEFPIKPEEVIKDYRLLYSSWMIFLATIGFFLIKDYVNISYASIAIVAASILLFIGGEKMPRVLEDVEWDTLIFLTSLFIIIGGLQKTGVISDLAEMLHPYISSNNAIISSSIIIWISATLSAVIANIPFTAAFIPILKTIATSKSGILWWALILGADLGGNATPIGAAPNVVALDLAKERGYKVTFKDFFKVGSIIVIATVGISNLYLIIRYVLLPTL